MLAVSDLYLRQVEQRVRAGEVGRCYLRNLEGVLRRHVEPELGGVSFGALTFLRVEGWLRRLNEGGASDYTRRLALKTLVRVEAFAFKRGLVGARVLAEVAKEQGRRPATKIKTFTLDEVKHILAVAAERGGKGRTERGALLCECFVNLAAICGLRIGEICALTPAHLDLAEGVIRVRQSLSRLDEVKPPKTEAGVRDVPMPAKVQDLLRRWQERFYTRNPRKLLFMTEGYVGAPPRSMGRYTGFHVGHWRPLLRRAGLETPENRYHFHALRHFASSFMIENGLSLPDVARLLGHSKFDMTLRVYAHPIIGPARHHATVAAMAAALSRDMGCNVASSAAK